MTTTTRTQTGLARPLPAEPDLADLPGPDTPVLANRPLVTRTDLRRLSRFRDDRWDLNPAIFEQHRPSMVVNFALIPAGLRQDAKHYIWVLLNRGQALRGGKDARLAVATIGVLFTTHLQYVLRWFAEQGVTQLSQVSRDMLWDFLTAMHAQDVPYPQRYRRIGEIRRLWRHRLELPEHMRLPQAPPWDGEDTMDLLGRTRGDRDNRTRRVGEHTMQMLLAWAMRFVEDFAADILTAFGEYQLWHSRDPRSRQRLGTAGAARHNYGELATKVHTYLDQLRRNDGTLPGRRDEYGQLHICWSHLAMMLDCNNGIRSSRAGELIRHSGLPIGETTWLPTPITGLLDGRPWREPGIAYDQAPVLARHLSTACFIIVSYLSGARVGEVLNLRRGCARLDNPTGLWLMDGLYFKGAEDEHGNKIPEGQHRPDPWVIIEPVAQAVAVLERLHTGPLLFPARLVDHAPRQSPLLRQGDGRSDRKAAGDLAAFVAWVNTECGRLGRPDVIPPDPFVLAPSRFRRTLAWFIRRRPRSLIAASIQYGHAYTRMTEGYAGSYESGFPDEYAYEDYLFRLDTLAEDEQALAGGEHVSGSAANTYRARVTAANNRFAGRVVVRERRARDLIGNPLLQIHHGEGMTCVFNPTTAACQIRGSTDDPMVTPDIDDCRPRCPNLARTDRDITRIKHRAADLHEIIADPLAPPIRHHREQAELNRLLAIVTDHQDAGDHR